MTAAVTDFDVIVIGGGVNGTGVARDCALRGMKVALFEKHDWGFGASGNSSGMIHGGARYLTDTPDVTRQSCQDSGYIQRIAPHLVFRIPFLFPIPARGLASRVALAAVDAFFAFYDRYQPLKGGKPHNLLSDHEARALEPGLAGDLRGAITFDEWGIDGARLCLANVLDAEAHGATCRAHHEVISLLREDDRVTGVIARDRETGARITATARRVVNSTGAWAPITASLASAPSSERAKVRPGKGIHVVFDRRIGNYAIVCKAIDGRQIFSMPWQNLSWLGTTDDDYYGDLDHVRAATDEVRYLVEGVARVVPSVASARVIGTTAGVRPTLYEYGPSEDDLSREHAIVDHTEDGASGLYSMIGGKLASYRIFAEEMTDRLARDLDVRAPGRTHELPLPGGEAPVDAHALAESLKLPEPAARRLAYRHGARVTAIAARLTRDRDERAVVCLCEPVIEAEVRHAVLVEGARDVSDVARRTRLGLGSCGGMRCAHRCAQIVAQERALPPRTAHRMAAEFLIDRYRTRVVALDGAQVRQEELAIARHVAAGMSPELLLEEVRATRGEDET
ncbi:glycerol-3-phosphate dehydrogenase/oxidase [Sandaracinus amylolyticus]|nr:glycerol-3-phosphate dehydrogenase/oxidase [Sandaracinus amylolyticus]